MYMDIARIVAKRSTCLRLNVGAVFVANNSIVSIGYNGVPSGQPHCHPTTCNHKQPCTRTTHAEVNGMLRMGEVQMGTEVDLYVTDSPCPHCYEQLVKMQEYAKIRIFFSSPYRLDEHIVKGVLPAYRVLPSGEIVDWRTKEAFND